MNSLSLFAIHQCFLPSWADIQKVSSLQLKHWFILLANSLATSTWNLCSDNFECPVIIKSVFPQIAKFSKHENAAWIFFLRSMGFFFCWNYEKLYKHYLFPWYEKKTNKNEDPSRIDDCKLAHVRESDRINGGIYTWKIYAHSLLVDLLSVRINSSGG